MAVLFANSTNCFEGEATNYDQAKTMFERSQCCKSRSATKTETSWNLTPHEETVPDKPKTSFSKRQIKRAPDLVVTNKLHVPRPPVTLTVTVTVRRLIDVSTIILQAPKADEGLQACRLTYSLLCSLWDGVKTCRLEANSDRRTTNLTIILVTGVVLRGVPGTRNRFSESETIFTDLHADLVLLGRTLTITTLPHITAPRQARRKDTGRSIQVHLHRNTGDKNSIFVFRYASFHHQCCGGGIGRA